MVSAIVVVAFESYLKARGAGHAHSHAHGFFDDDDDDDDLRTNGDGLAERRGHGHRPANISVDDLDSAQGLVAGASPLPESTPTIPPPPRVSKRPSQGLGDDDDDDNDDNDLHLDMDELDPAPSGGRRADSYHSLKPDGRGATADHDVAAHTPEEHKRQMLQCLLLEAGILFHSVFIGMAVSVATGPAFVVFLVAISFHQSFEGLALGSRIAAIRFPRSSIRPWLMVLAYGVTTPLGQAIGLVVHKMYDPASMGGLLVVGFMNAVSSGLLLYAGLVQLLAEDFLTEKSYAVLLGRNRLHAFLAVVGGALLMALVGTFA